MPVLYKPANSELAWMVAIFWIGRKLRCEVSMAPAPEPTTAAPSDGERMHDAKRKLRDPRAARRWAPLKSKMHHPTGHGAIRSLVTPHLGYLRVGAYTPGRKAIPKFQIFGICKGLKVLGSPFSVRPP